jgi:hypothetical protein
MRNKIEYEPYCDQCQLVHGPEHRFCQRCGQLLRVDIPGRKCSRCNAATFPGQKFCTDCGLPLRVAPPGLEEEAPPERHPLFYSRGPEVRSHRRRTGRVWLPLLGTLLIIFGGVYLFHKFSGKAPAVISEELTADRKEQRHQEELKREVERVAEKIRSAHLNKDINRFISCYSSSYPQLGQLEADILRLYKDYDFENVDYRLSNIRPQGDKQILAKITWSFRIVNPVTKAGELIQTTYETTLEKSDDGWKIRDSRPVD